MKPTAVLVNTARGPVVDENALVDALEAGTIYAAGLDVFDGEPAVNPRLLCGAAHDAASPHRQCNNRDTYAHGAAGVPGRRGRPGGQDTAEHRPSGRVDPGIAADIAATVPSGPPSQVLSGGPGDTVAYLSVGIALLNGGRLSMRRVPGITLAALSATTVLGLTGLLGSALPSAAPAGATTPSGGPRRASRRWPTSAPSRAHRARAPPRRPAWPWGTTVAALRLDHRDRRRRLGLDRFLAARRGDNPVGGVVPLRTPSATRVVARASSSRATVGGAGPCRTPRFRLSRSPA